MFDSLNVILYVADVAASAAFYGTLIGKPPVEASPNFAMFILASGDTLGLWANQDVQPAPNPGGGSELIFTAKDKAEVDSRHREWKQRGWAIAQSPVQMDFGYTFTALDPDKHRLRVFFPARP